MPRKRNTENDFWGLVKKGTPTECWEWQGYKRGKYGICHIDGERDGAHRTAWRLYHNQDIPSGMFICHTCDNPPCCNPAHLFSGTPQDNVDDMVAKGRNVVVLPPRKEGGAHTNAKLTDSQADSIRAEYATDKAANNANQCRLAKKYNVSQSTISLILLGKRY